MNRRRFLQRTGAAVGLGALAGCTYLDNTSPETEQHTGTGSPTPGSGQHTGTGSPTPTMDLEAPFSRYEITFQRVLHAVDDLGMDPTGKEPIDAKLDEAYGDNTLVAFPPGTYHVTDQHTWKQNTVGFGIMGLGQRKQDVQFTFPKGNRGAPDPANYWFLRVENGRDHLLENVTIQQTDDTVTGVGMVFYQEDGLEIHDVELGGFNPTYSHDPGFGIIAAMTTRAGVGSITGFTCTDGGVIGLYPKRKIPIASYQNHVGELRIFGAHIANAGEHSMYVSRTPGCVRVRDGLFVNNDNSNLRMSGGGHPNKRSWAKNCRIVIDTENAKHLPKGEKYQGARGIWVESGGEFQYGHNDLLLENISVEAYTNARPAVLLLHEHSHGSLTVRNCSFESEVEGATVIDSRFPFTKWVKRPYDIELEDVSVSTTANKTVSGYAVRIDSRPDSLVRNVDIDLGTRYVSGLLVEKSNGTQILNTTISQPTRDDGDALGQVELGTGIVISNTANYTMQNVDFSLPGQNVRIDGAETNGTDQNTTTN